MAYAITTSLTTGGARARPRFRDNANAPLPAPNGPIANSATAFFRVKTFASGKTMIGFMIKAILSFFAAMLVIAAALGLIYLASQILCLPFRLIGALFDWSKQPSSSGPVIATGNERWRREWERGETYQKRLAAKTKARRGQGRAGRAKLLKASASWR
jgi:hypothetical protein